MKASRSKNLPPPVVRREPPTVDEAAFAALGLSDDFEQQVEIAAGLMDVSPEQARESLTKLKAARTPAGTTRASGHVTVRDRIVTVERTSVRRVTLPSRTAMAARYAR